MSLLRLAARTAVVSGTATAVSGRVAQRQAARYRQGQPSQWPSEPPAAPPQDPAVARLEELARLHAAGVLSDEEFAAAKARALGI